MNNKRFGLMIVLAGLALFGLTRVANSQGTTLNVLVEGGGYQLQKDAAAQFEKETGHKINFVQAPYAGVFDKLTADVAGGTSSFDVATIDVAWLARFKDFAEPLDSLYTPAIKKDIFPSLIADATFNGSLIGVPTWANAEIFFYRKDLFGDPKNQADFQKRFGYALKPPTNWKQLQDAAVFFTKDGMYGLDVKAKVETEFLALALQAGAPDVIVDADGNSTIMHPANLRALQFLTDLYRKYKVSPNPVDIDWGAAQQLFYQGKTAMMLFWGHAYRLTPEDSKVEGKVGVTQMIAGSAGSAAIPGSWYNIVPKTGKNKEVAKAFVKYLLEHNSLGMTAPLGLSARISSFNEYANKPGYEYVTPLVNTLKARKTKGRPRVLAWQQIADEVLVPMLQYAVSGDKTPAEAIAWADQQIKAIKK
jgi:multiple sugar transport system substrate-binding protein